MISTSLEELSLRLAWLQQIFAAMARGGKVFAFARPTATQFILALGEQGAGGLRGLRHPTKSRRVYLNYFEIWDDAGSGTQFTLNRAYLHLDTPRPDGTGDEELLALHCDPLTPASDGAYRYKRGPHMHFQMPAFDFDRAHVSLCLRDSDIISQDIAAFDDLMQRAIRMIDEEFLLRVEEADL